jgi:hypothetical protein
VIDSHNSVERGVEDVRPAVDDIAAAGAHRVWIVTCLQEGFYG